MRALLLFLFGLPSVALAQSAETAAVETATPAESTSPPTEPVAATEATPAVPDVDVDLVADLAGETPHDLAPRRVTGTPWIVELGMQVFAQYELSFPRGADWFHE